MSTNFKQIALAASILFASMCFSLGVSYAMNMDATAQPAIAELKRSPLMHIEWPQLDIEINITGPVK